MRPVAFTPCVIALALLAGCSAQSLSDEGADAMLPKALGSSVAPAGKVRLFVGQDTATIDAYRDTVAEPSGIVSYTSLAGLEGLHSASDTGGGAMYLDQLTAKYPGAPIALGLYLVGELDAVNGGSLDAQLAELGAALAGYQVPVLVRVGYEFDATWSHYEPDAYQQAFTRIRTGLRAAGAVNAELVWQAAASCGQTYENQSPESWYPGDDAVDWIACSYFAQAACQLSSVKAMLHLAREHGKPFFIAESAPQGYDLARGTFSQDGSALAPKTGAQIYGDWYGPYFELVAENSDVIRAVSYIDANWNAQPMWGPPYQNGYFGDSRVQANPDILKAWLGELGRDAWIKNN